MEWEVEFTTEFEEWWGRLDAGEQEDIDSVVGVLERVSGVPMLGR